MSRSSVDFSPTVLSAAGPPFLSCSCAAPALPRMRRGWAMPVTSCCIPSHHHHKRTICSLSLSLIPILIQRAFSHLRHTTCSLISSCIALSLVVLTIRLSPFTFLFHDGG